MKKYILSIDQGTTSSRVVLYDTKFKICSVIQKEFKQFFPKDGWVEHDAIEIWKDVKNLIAKTLKKNKLQSSQILSIGIANQRETTILWNKKTGMPINKAIVWQDRRTSEYCAQLKKKKKDVLIQNVTGLVLDPYFSATKIKWIIENNNNLKKLIKNNNLLFGTIDTWLLWNLTEGRSHLTDITNAARTMIYDSKQEVWSNTLLKLFKIPKSILPKVVENAYNFGTSNLFGSPIKIGGMAGDQQAATIGQACFQPGQSKSTYGTGCFLLMNIGNKFKKSSNKLLTTVAFKINRKKMYCYEGSIFVAGSAIQWLRDKMHFFNNSSETNLLYARANAEENIVVVPALTGLGAPHWKPNARGAIFGLTRNTSKEDIVKATIDSLSLQTLDLIKAMQKDAKISIKEIRVDGGMINNDNFLQSLSNITQINIIKPQNIETTSLGVAYLAALNIGLINNTDHIEKLWKKNKIAKPKLSKKKLMPLIQRWRKSIDTLIKLNS
ncbi:MAG: Glycerol kinase [Alphaproteobacteria bacterium MarineAlpha5_Bin5]|nr:MAG: Glycerol kinase [Alphaproteobacteria bacterium MarineAlpha5_Bin5]PPR51928.1 MAG: Glycerol kinase [Alphaproteobacteria bacterium MarineAlpha5_Bin4]|tara:strand:+ start:11620 stop:13104 length:1485 start_codon:yes stop_codon:yes gene_type:complete